MRRLRATRAVYALFCFSLACASAPKPMFPPVPYEAFAGTLFSGIRIVVYQLPDTRVFSLDASYLVGAVDDPPGKEGLALLATRVIERRAGAAKGLTFSTRLFMAGVRFEAVAGTDATDFTLHGTPDRLNAALSIEADRLRDPLAGITEEDLRLERSKLLKELDTSTRQLRQETQLQWLRQAALPPGPYGRPAGGTPESLRSITLEDLRGFCKTHFAPDRLILAVVGPHPPRETAKLAETILGPPPMEGVRVVPWTRPQLAQPPRNPVAPETVVHRGPVKAARLWLGWVVPSDPSRLGTAASIAKAETTRALARVIPMVRTRFLARRVVTRVRRSDAFTLIATRVAVESEDQALSIVAAMKRLDGPGAEASRASRLSALQLQVAVYRELEHPDAKLFAWLARTMREADVLAAWKRAASSHVSEDIDPYAREWLDPRRAATLIVAPEAGHVEADPPVPGEAEETEEIQDLARLQEPRLPPGTYDVLGLARPPGLDAATRKRLGNGLEVVVLRWPGFPKVEARLVVKVDPPGTTEVPLDLPQLALAASRLRAISDPPRLAGAARRPYAPPGYSCDRPPATFYMNHVLVAEAGLVGHTERLLERLACWAQNLAIDAGEFDLLKESRAKARRKASAGSLTLPMALFARLYPSEVRPPALDIDGTQLTLTRADDWLSRALRPDRTTLILAGELRPDETLFDQIEKLFGSWRVWREGPATPRPAVVGSVRRGPILLANQSKARWAWIQGMAAIPSKVVAEGPPFRAVLEEIAWDLQRDRAGGAIENPRIELAVTPLGHALLVTVRVPSDRSAVTVRRVMEAFDAAALVPPSPGLTGVLRWMLGREFPFSFETASGAAGALVRLALGDHRPDFWERYPAAIDSLSPEQIQSAATGLDERVVGVIGDAETVLPRLKEAGFQVEVLPEPPAAKP